MSRSELPVLFLKRHEERRLRRGHPWVFSNEVDVARSPLAGLAPGAPVEVRSHSGALIGSAYANPATLICARMVSRRAGVRLDRERLRARLGAALAVREWLFETPYYRLAYGESDALPGLVCDRYDDVLVVQIGTAGMERLREAVVDVLVELLEPRAVVLRNDGAGRELEGLARYVEVAAGSLDGEVEVVENGARFRVDVRGGQKTGWYYDQRDNRARLAPWCRGRRVLDCFSYAGAWGVAAGLAGARELCFVDASREALEGALANAERNGLGAIARAERGDAFAVLRALAEAGERFDVVVLDPPAFVRRRKDLRAGLEAYRRINRLALRLLAGEGGILASASCSAHLGPDDLLGVVRAAAGQAGVAARVIGRGGQGADHPVHPAMPESAYLKCVFAHVSR